MFGPPSRSDQVGSLLRTVPSTAQRSPDVFDVGIRLSDQKILTLRTELPSTFPGVPPVIRILDPGATHPWLDSSGRVAGLADLYNWDERSSDLGQVVQRALTEFCTRPPHINPALIRAEKTRTSWVQSLPSSTQQPAKKNESSQGIQLSVPDNFPELDALDQKRLQELLDNDGEFDTFFNGLSFISNARQLRDSVRQGNVERATENTNLAKEATDLQSRVSSLNKQMSESRNMFTRLIGEQKSMASLVDPRKLAEEFEALARQTDSTSEDVLSRMFDDPASVDAALTRFRSLRVQYHLRKATADRCRAQYSS